MNITSLTSLYDVKHNKERATKQWEKRIMNFIVNLILLKNSQLKDNGFFSKVVLNFFFIFLINHLFYTRNYLIWKYFICNLKISGRDILGVIM